MMIEVFVKIKKGEDNIVNYDKNIYKVCIKKDKKLKYTHHIPYIKKRQLDEGKNVFIVGKTKLKKLKKNKKQQTDLLVDGKKKYIVKNKIFGFTKGYIYVGNNRYIEIKRKHLLLLILLVLLFLLSFDTKEPVKKKILDPITPIIDDITGLDDIKPKVTDEKQKNKIIKKQKIEKENIFKIEYQLNGGELVNQIKEYKKGSNFELPIPNKKGYDFLGWYLDKEFNKKISKITKNMEKDIILYAKWEAIQYSINYNINGGTLENLPTIYTIESEDITIGTPTRTGYDFTGWTTPDNDTPKKDVTIKHGTIGNITFTANWKIINYNLNYNLYGGTADNLLNNYNVENDTFQLDKPTKTGYNFMGWTGNNIVRPTKVVTVETGTTGDLSFDANWRLRDYTIYYKLNGGILDKARATYSIESDNFIIDMPIKTGYNFMGWTGSNGSKLNKQIQVNTGTIGDMFFSANWRLVYYDIKYNLNGGTLENPPTIYTVESEDITIGTPTKRGYDFLGWTTPDNDTPKKDVTIKHGTIGNITFTANWKPTIYSINYNLNGGKLTNKVETYTIEDEDITIGTPTRTGYDFTGWTDENGNTSNTITIKNGSIGNRTFTANWKIRTHTVTYKNPNGSVYSSQRVNYNAQVPMLGYSVDSVHVFNGWIYNGGIIGGLAMPDNDITLTASVRETNCYLLTGQAQDGDNSRIARFQELLAQKGLGGRWNLEYTGYYDFISDSSNYSHVLSAANHLLANASASSWPSLRWLYMTCDNGYGVQLR